MANKRMFSIDVTETDTFLEMPLTAQALYFHFAMRGDDDGFVSNPRSIMRVTGCNENDLKTLAESGYILAKNKEGRVGEVPLTFDKTRQRFLALTSELERR